MGTLQVVATPIGNLEDITLRALRGLAEADLLFAEDTRRTRVLLDRHAIAARPVSLNAHNERARIERALAVLDAGGRVALVSDAGTPGVSDPGGRLVEAAIAAGHRVEALPGPSAVLAALTVSGLSPQPFVFLGFLPRRPGQRRRLLADHARRAETLVVFESPKRLGTTLAALAEALGGDRRACVARELTKLHEEVSRARLGDLAVQFADGARGEVTIVIEGRSAEAAASTEPVPDEPIGERIRTLVAEGRRPREIAALLASATTLPRREVYALAVAARERAAKKAAPA